MLKHFYDPYVLHCYYPIIDINPEEPRYYWCREAVGAKTFSGGVKQYGYLTRWAYWDGEKWDDENIDDWLGETKFEKNDDNLKDKYRFD